MNIPEFIESQTKRLNLMHNELSNENYMKKKRIPIVCIWRVGIICIKRGAGHSWLYCLWDSAGTLWCLWGGPCGFYRMHTCTDYLLIWKGIMYIRLWEPWEKVRLRLKLYIDIFLQGKGLNYVNDEMIMHWEKCNELYTYNWIILKEGILPVDM